MKKNTFIISVLLFLIVCLVGSLLYQKKYYQKELNNNAWTSNDYIDTNNEEDEYDCSFTKTYRVVNLLDDYIAEVPEWYYVAVDSFQNHSIFAAKIPFVQKEKLQEDNYYEFTYTIIGKGNIKNMEDINSYLVLDNSNLEFKVTLNVKETDKQGLEQIQQDICLPKKNVQDTIKFNKYLERDNGRIIYLASNLDEFYVYDSSNKKQTLKEYSKTYQTLDEIIKYITSKLTLSGELNDGGTKIYKSKEKNTTIVVCHTVSGNSDIFLGDYNMSFDIKNNTMCHR